MGCPDFHTPYQQASSPAWPRTCTPAKLHGSFQAATLFSDVQWRAAIRVCMKSVRLMLCQHSDAVQAAIAGCVTQRCTPLSSSVSTYALRPSPQPVRSASAAPALSAQPERLGVSESCVMSLMLEIGQSQRQRCRPRQHAAFKTYLQLVSTWQRGLLPMCIQTRAARDHSFGLSAHCRFEVFHCAVQDSVLRHRATQWAIQHKPCV